MSQPLIGGLFGLDESLETSRDLPPFLKGGELLLANARSGLKLLVELLHPSKVWMPSFLCSVIVDAVSHSELEFYEVGGRLQISENWISRVQHGELVVFIDYFGLPFDSSMGNYIRDRGAWIVEDASQALLSVEVGKASDFVLFSPRKFIGVPDGGILRNNTSLTLATPKLVEPPAPWWLKAFNATVLRREFDLYGKDRSWFRIFQEAERHAPLGPYRMSELSTTLLQHNFMYSSISQRRIANYRILNEYLSDFALLSHLPPGVIPMAYPIRLKNRERVREKLFENEIYPPVHWPIEGIVPRTFRESHELAGNILSLICDQRYGPADMVRTAKLVLDEV